MSPRPGMRNLLQHCKMNDQYGNVYENKGSSLHGYGTSGNVTENKGSYALKAGILLKLKVVSRW
jgi:hypothetical protein